MTTPYYSALPKEALDVIEAIITEHGYCNVVCAIGDILSQNVSREKPSHASFSFELGRAMADARKLDAEIKRSHEH
jgi:hypothetical protein